jgi:hypothetical protein
MIVTVLAWTGVVIALFILGLLIIPIKILARGSVDDRDGLDYLLVIDWAFGFFSLRAVSDMPAALYFAGLRVWPIPLKTGKKKKPSKTPKKGKPSPLTWLGWIRENFSLIKHILYSFVRASFLRGYLNGTIGLADPADTAFVSLLCRLIQMHTKCFHVSIATTYGDEIIHVRAKVQSTLIIGYLGLVALRLLLDKQIRLMLRGLPRNREKEVLL